MTKNSLTGKTTTTIANHEYVRLNDIADRFGKRLDNWMRLQNTKDLIESFRKDYASQNQEPFNVVMGRMAVEAIDEILDEESGESPLKTVKGGTTVLKNTDKDGVKELIQQGTWAHPVLAQKFIEWCDRSPNKASDSVYLICAVGVKMTKIGIAHNANNRIANLRIGSPIRLDLFRVEPSLIAGEIESRAHKLASKWHSHGEWFNLSGREASAILDKAIKQISIEAQNL